MPSQESCSITALGFTPLRVRALYPPARVEADLFLPGMDGNPPQLYTTAALPPSADDLDRLLKRGYTNLYMRYDQALAYRAQLRELAHSQLDMPPEIRFEITREAVRDSFARAWREVKPQTFVAAAEDFSQQVVDICTTDAEMAAVLASLAFHDGDTFEHISNVCTYTVMLARRLGISKDRDLEAIGQAGLLHDLGKRKVCQDILQKPGKLTPAEREIISDHPRMGFVELCHHPAFTAEQLLMVYQHHEKLDGTGYPARLVSDEICWTAKLCAVCDVFDALTAKRSYRAPAGREQALEIIEQGIGKQFCPEFARCWTDLAGRITGTPV